MVWATNRSKAISKFGSIGNKVQLYLQIFKKIAPYCISSDISTISIFQFFTCDKNMHIDCRNFGQ